VIYALGDVKTNTSRFATDELRRACGANSGDWATFTTDVHLADDSHFNVMAVAHRRGPEVHTFLSTCGVTMAGKPQRHKDDDLDVDTGWVISRKCPAVLNDATLAQPKIDRGNRRRQHDLAMEKRFRTEVRRACSERACGASDAVVSVARRLRLALQQAFPFRMFTTMLGVCFTDTYYLDQYFNKSELVFRQACERMAWATMYNNIDRIANGECDSADLYRMPKPDPDAESPFTSSPAKSVSSCTRVGHLPVPLYCIPGYEGARQQKCAVCTFNGVKKQLKTSYCCVLCSSKDYIVPIHPAFTGIAKPSGFRCAIEHRKQPSKHPGVRPKVKKPEVAEECEQCSNDEEEHGEHAISPHRAQPSPIDEHARPPSTTIVPPSPRPRPAGTLHR
jgi:hypothetical protein